MPTRWRIDVVSNTPPTLAMFQMRTSIRLLATLPTFFSMLSRSVFKCMRRQNVKNCSSVARISDSVTRIIDRIYRSKRSVGCKPRRKKSENKNSIPECYIRNLREIENRMYIHLHLELKTSLRKNPTCSCVMPSATSQAHARRAEENAFAPLIHGH